MAVLEPLKVVITNYPDDEVEYLEAVNNPEDESAGVRQVAFSKVLYIEQDDFREVPPKRYYRLSPGTEVRLRYAYFIRCTDVIEMRPAKWSKSTVPTTPRPKAATPPMAAR
jgi:glutaminyl-tRNA synthetase